MVETRTIEAAIKPIVKPEDMQTLRDIIAKEFQASLNISQAAGAPTIAGGEGAGTSNVEKAVTDTKETITTSNKTIADAMGKNTDVLGGVKGEGEEQNSKLSVMGGALKDGFSTVIGIAQFGWDIIQEIFKILRKSSPLLDEILGWFDLAINLLLMPLATAVALEILPIMTKMLTKTTEMMSTLWDAYEGGGLEGILAATLVAAIEIFAETLYEIIDVVFTGNLKPLGDALKGLISFIEKNALDMLNHLKDIAIWTIKFVTNLPVLFGTIGALLGVMIGLQITQITTTAASGGFLGTGLSLGWATAGPGIALSLAGGIIGASAGFMMGDGGWVDPVPGGTPRILGERGEREYVVPESKAGAFASAVGGGGNTYIFNGMGNDEVIRIVRQENAMQVAEYRTRGAYI